MKLGINGENMVYLDLSHKDPKELDVKLGGIIEIYEKFMGDDPRKIPMKIFPAVHYSMGGLWVDYNQMTNIPGLFAAGECDFQYHGANRLGANSLLSSIFGGMVAGPKAIEYVHGLKKHAADVDPGVFEGERKRHTEKYESLLKMSGTENAYVLHKELGEWMTNNMTVVRFNKKLEETIDKIKELKERYRNINITDTSRWNNQGVAFTRQLWNMLELAHAMTLGGLLRNETRGAHYKPEFPNRDDDNFMKTTIAKHTPDGPEISYEAVDVSLIPPRVRDYSKGGH
jgi:succinate dehydrogenase / fumarate reductase flavoprotein subunit